MLGDVLQLAGGLLWTGTGGCLERLVLCERDRLNPSGPWHLWRKTLLGTYCGFTRTSPIPGPQTLEESCSTAPSLTKVIQEVFALPSVSPAVFPSHYFGKEV